MLPIRENRGPRSPVVHSPAAASWSILPLLLTVPTTRIGFALSAFDTQSGSVNPNGIFQAVLYKDDKPVIGFQMDKISYDNTRNVNAHIDYKTRAMGGTFLQQLFYLPGYPAPSIYRSPVPIGGSTPGPARDPANQTHPVDGTICLEDGRIHTIKIEVKDTYGNTSELRFRVQFQPQATVTDTFVPPAGKKFYPGMLDGLDTTNCAFYLGEKSLYDSVNIDAIVSGYPGPEMSLPDAVSGVYTIGEPWIPLLEPILVRLRPALPAQADLSGALLQSLPAIDDKIVMVCFRDGYKEVQRPEWQGGWASAHFHAFGNFQLVADSIPPVITPIGIRDGADLSHANRIAFSVKDNLGAVRKFRAELDGSWLCFTNDKGQAYIYQFDEHCPPGKHLLKVTVEDIAGNRAEAAYRFSR
jgi:hypothetical protein